MGKNRQVPMPSVEEKMPKTKAETVASFVRVGKTIFAGQRGFSTLLEFPL
jgi:hypothetical protein